MKHYCIVCKKDRDMKNGKFCDKGHFICVKHIYTGLPGGGLKSCPVDGTKLK
jgi:hypothetical protein